MKFKKGDKVIMIKYFSDDGEMNINDIGKQYRDWINNKKVFTISGFREDSNYSYSVVENGESFTEEELKLAKIIWKEAIQ